VLGSARSVSIAGAILSSILCATPAFSQCRLPIAAHSSLTSQHRELAVVGRPRARHSAE
jgi:hypothetical protein